MNLDQLLAEKREDLISLQDTLSDHDCHLSPEDGCDCSSIRDEIDDVQDEIDAIEMQMNNNVDAEMERNFDEDTAKEEDYQYGAKLI